MPPAEPDPREVEAKPFQGGGVGERVRDAGSPPRASSANAWAMACHLCGLLDFGVGFVLLGVLVPLGIWLAQRDIDPFVDRQGREAVNFQLNLLFWAALSIPLIFLCGIGFVLLGALALAEVVLVILAAIAAAEGRDWRYPWIVRVVG